VTCFTTPSDRYGNDLDAPALPTYHLPRCRQRLPIELLAAHRSQAELALPLADRAKGRSRRSLIKRRAITQLLALAAAVALLINGLQHRLDVAVLLLRLQHSINQLAGIRLGVS